MSTLSSSSSSTLSQSTSTEEIYKQGSSYCTIFIPQLWRKDRCKHCFKTEQQHSINISRFNEANNGNNNNNNNNNEKSNNNITTPKNNISNNNPYINNLKNINNNSNNSNNNLTSPTTPSTSSPVRKNNKVSSSISYSTSSTSPSPSKSSPLKSTNITPSVERAPLSIRRSLTPKAIEQFSRQISSQLLVSEPLSLPPQTIINNINKQSSLSNSQQLKPKPPLPAKTFQLSPQQPQQQDSSTSTTPDTSSPSLSSFSLDNNNNTTTETTTTTTTTTTSLPSSPPIEPSSKPLPSVRQTTIISPVLLAISEFPAPISPSRQMRSHSDSPNDYPTVIINNGNSNVLNTSNTSTGSNNSRAINISGSNLIYEKKHTRNLSGNSQSFSLSSSPTNSSPSLQSISQQQVQSSKTINNLQSSGNSNNNVSSSSSPRKYSIFVGKSNKLKSSNNINNSSPNLPTTKKPITSLKSTSFPNVAEVYNNNNNNNNNNVHYNNNNNINNSIYIAINSILISLPGISNQTVQSMMEILYNQHNFEIDSINTTLIKSDKMNELSKSIITLQQWVERQDNLRKVIKVQSCVRRFLSKRRTEWLSQVYNGSILRDRNNEFRGLIQLERRYNEKLEITISAYYKPLKQANLLNRMDLQSIFSSIKQIYYVHQRISLQFEELFKKWPCVEGLGDIFLRIAPELKVYGGYVKNFKNAIDTLISCQEENPKFASFLRDCCDNTPGKVYDLMALIAAPLNHLTGYERQLFNIALYTPQNWPDYVNIINAVTMMKEVETLIQENLGQAQNESTLMTIYRRIRDRKALDPFVIPGRIFIHEGKLIKFELKKQDQVYYYYLCNDLILFVKSINNNNSSSYSNNNSTINNSSNNNNNEIYKFKKLFMLSDVIVSDLIDTTTHKNIISIVNQNNSRESYSFSIEDSREKKELMKQFSTLCCTTNTNKSTKIFGISLVDLIQREEDISGNGTILIPSFIIKVCNAIILNHLDDEGIFRVSPNQGELEIVRESINKCTTESQLDVIIGRISGHQLAALLKCYFRELSIPLLTFELFDKVIETYGNNNSDIDSAENEANQIIGIKQLLNGIPIVNQNVFQLILLLLNTVAENSEVNKMTAVNLSIVFSPNLLKPKIPSIENSLKIPIINNFITSLLDNYNLLYSDKLDFIKIIDSKIYIKQPQQQTNKIK